MEISTYGIIENLNQIFFNHRVITEKAHTQKNVHDISPLKEILISVMTFDFSGAKQKHVFFLCFSKIRQDFQKSYKDDRRLLPSSHCTKTKPKFPRYGRCHLVLVTSLGARVCTIVIGGSSHDIEID